MPSILITLAILLPLIAFGLHQYLFGGVETPPANFGSGTMFDLIASRYDFINRVLALNMDVSWRQEMVDIVAQVVSGLDHEPQILDMATGTADVALLLSKSIPMAKIRGMDPSSNMLQVGQNKIDAAGKSKSIRLELGGVEALGNALPEKFFDAATMAFGIRNVPNRESALCEIHRVLKPYSSIFCILEFSEPDESAGVMGYFAKLFIRHVVPIVGGILSGKPKEYLHLQNSIKDFPTPQNFVKLMEGLSCGKEGKGRFRVDELKQLNFGSVQLYVTVPIEG